MVLQEHGDGGRRPIDPDQQQGGDEQGRQTEGRQLTRHIVHVRVQLAVVVFARDDGIVGEQSAEAHYTE